MIDIRAVVVTSPDSDPEFMNLKIHSPEGSEVLLKVEACGICHSDIHYMTGTSGREHPYLLGHEVVGRVVEMGETATGVSLGQRVVCGQLVACDVCAECKRGRPQSCRNRRNAARQPVMDDGALVNPVLGIGGMATHVLVSSRLLTPIDERIPIEQAALLGCGFSTGFGAMLNTSGVRRGDSVMVLGAGGVGLGAIAAAAHLGAGRIVVSDVSDEAKTRAVAFGATQTIYSSDLKTLMPDYADSFDIVVDNVGGAELLSQAFALVAKGGRVVINGAPRMDENITLALRPLFAKRVELTFTHWDCKIHDDIALVSTLTRLGELPLSLLVGEIVPFAGAVDCYRQYAAGEVHSRRVVLMP